MDDKRSRERQRQVRRLMKALTDGEPVIITEGGEFQLAPATSERGAPPIPTSFQDLIALRRQEYDRVRSERPTK
jgi:antitoxin (DNA-binding transcriptional repressor) of toxin-antitoxin stability system